MRMSTTVRLGRLRAASLMAASTLLASCAALSPRPQNVAASLADLRLEVPCSNPKFNGDTECHWDQTLLQSSDPAWKLKRELTRKLGGKGRCFYEVTLHVRGVVEPKNFIGGKVTSGHFQAGGTPVKDDYNFYSLHVSAPEATYTFNREERKVGHYTFPIDYRVAIRVRGRATLTMGAYDSNDVAIANHQHLVVPGVPPAPLPFDGQFFQLDVVSVRIDPEQYDVSCYNESV